LLALFFTFSSVIEHITSKNNT